MTMEVDLPRGLGTLLREVLEGPAATGAYVLNRGDKGLSPEPDPWPVSVGPHPRLR